MRNKQLPTTKIKDKLTFSVYNKLGQILASYRLENENGQGYEYDLDMSYVAAGIYLAHIGNEKIEGIKRLIVK